MLTGIHVAFLGGDARQLEVIEKFSELDASITLIGFDNLEPKYSGVKHAELNEEVLKTVDVLILHAVVANNTGKIDSIFSSKELQLTESHLKSLPKHAKLYTGFSKPYFRSLCQENRVELIELFERDDVAIYNSIPTAEGAIMMAIENTDITIHGSRCIVLGLGRTGVTLARTLKGIGAQVSVGVRRHEHFARAYEMQLNPFLLRDLCKEVTDIDLLFNTIPTMIVTAEVIAHIPHRAVIIDLASKPGGTDFRFAEKRGVKAMIAPGLPGIVAPKTAGQIIAKSLIQLISEDSSEWGSEHELEK
ncbi:dipicolinate synthase subunit DpsA [Chengkuizengella axinellae]|uniref:Dipicolinate synthase subunit DpsA n=1 Tax=Chengkuizengella axinellae TaxID=3064388 RepID=A0ABT9IXG7_9BACL|nr:dipicolinate synthase subunit DpsA [Chengkuizengella sp. 2205SS18-9]MDP5273494.1 dipicolinate synthase subunit DpsA [Chengkuizengella sp. 2205SS18-9]